MNGKLYRAKCLQCSEGYEDFVYTLAGNTSRQQRASKSNRNIWAAAHCERTGHVRFQIDDIDRHVAILRSPGPHDDGALELDDIQVTLDDVDTIPFGPSTFELPPGEVQG
jgi:hypothetical protein